MGHTATILEATVYERARRALTRLARALTAVRRIEPLARVTLASVAALALLTTFTTVAPAPEATTAAAASSGVLDLAVEPGDGGDGTTGRTVAAPELERLLTAELDVDSGGGPEIPAVGEGRELDAFEHRSPSEVTDGEVVPVDLILRADEGSVAPEELAEPLTGARHVAPAAGLTATTPVPGSDEPREVSLLGVDGATFRPLAPEVTASADAVWQRFAEGDVLVSHELAEELDLELGRDILLATDSATLPVRIGAFAANGQPALADILVPVDVAALLGVASPNTLVVAAGGGDPKQLGDALAAATGGEVELRREPAAPVAEERTTPETPSGRIEPFTYTSHADGRISIHGDWTARNIVPVQLPGMAATSCHRVMVPQLLAVVDELIERDLYSHLDPSQFAGCFVARHIDWNPSKPLSMHAWGLAIDFNTRDNWLGATPQMDPRVVEVFERWGFEWGGRWNRPDGMHFELDRIVPVP